VTLLEAIESTNELLDQDRPFVATSSNLMDTANPVRISSLESRQGNANALNL
jgi:hypothetical protein